MRGTSSTREPQKNRAGYGRWGRFLLGGTALAATTYMSVQAIRCRRALHDAVDKLASYPIKTVHLSYGEIAYLDIMPTGSSSAYSDPPVSCLCTVSMEATIKPLRMLGSSRNTTGLLLHRVLGTPEARLQVKELPKNRQRL